MILLRRKHKQFFWRNRKFFFLLCCILVVGTLWEYHKLDSFMGQWTKNPEDDHLDHFRRTRSLAHYLDNIDLLVEPSTTICETSQHIPVVVLVASAPDHRQQRDAIRRTWARRLPAYFLLGLQSNMTDLNQTINEATDHNDVILFNFSDHYQNLTLKTGLMLRWVASRCPHVGFFYKLDDDVLLNPWILNNVLRDHPEAQLLGFTVKDALLFRGRDEKYYLPKWLHYEDRIPHFLTGPGYLIKGNLTGALLQEAYRVPLINLEDVYYTNLVATRLKVNLTHDYRLAPRRALPKRWVSICAFWLQASSHSVRPEEMLDTWTPLAEIGARYERGESVCYFYDKYVKWLVPLSY